MNEIKPPAWMISIIDWLAPYEIAEEIQGDLYELFIKDIEQKGKRPAKRKYVINGIGFLLKSFFWNKKQNHNPFPMLTSYFKMGKRSLLANKGTTAINILGLVTGIATSLVILSVIRFELSFDSFHSNRDRIYRVVRVSGEDMSEFRSGVSNPVPVALKAEIPSLEGIVAVEYYGGANVDVLDASGTTEQKFREEAGAVFVQDNFFKVFDYKNTTMRWLEGNPDKALTEPHSVVLTRTMAKKYFGNESPLGKTLKFQRRLDCKVTGVIEDFPSNTDFPFTILISYSTLPILAGQQRMEDWFSVNDSHQVFLVLREGTSQKEMEKQIAAVHAAHTPKELHESRHYLLQKLADVHFEARFGTFSGRTISRETINGLIIVALFLLLTGSINYINLSTAQSVLRSKEVGLRKVMGSSQSNIILQFVIETLIVVSLAGTIAYVLAAILRFNLQSLLNLKLNTYDFGDPFLISSTLIIVAVVTIFSGLYPSLIVARFNPVTALKSKFTTDNFRGVSLRKVLVVLQFTITQMLVVGTYIVVTQMEYFRNVDIGFNKEAVITSRTPDRRPSTLHEMENQLRSLPYVSDVSFHYTVPSGVVRNRSFADVGLPSATEMKDHLVYEYFAIDSSYLNLFQIDLLAGRNMTLRDSATSVIVNKTLCKNLELGSPEEALGKEVKMGGGEKFTIVGVVDDFYTNSLKEGFDNVVMFMQPENYSAVSVKLNVKGHQVYLPDAVNDIGKIWSTTFPEFIFTYNFVDENVAAFYVQEQKYSQLFQLFSIIFLVIGCLGLYGLISFVVNRKGKEVAIRKVLGASIRNIIMLFSTEYIRLIILSFILATPAAYYVVNGWLSNFANHITLQWWLFVIPGTLVLTIALLVVSAKSLRAARSNPVDALKYE